jgi:hypothetical protein
MKNLKAGLIVVVVIAGAILLSIQHQAQEKLRAENESLSQQIAQLQTDNESLSNRLAAIGEANSLTDEQLNELLRLRGQVGVLRQQNKSSEQFRAESLEASQALDLVRGKWLDTDNAEVDLNEAFNSYWEKHNQMLPTAFDQLKDYFPTDSPSYFALRDKFEFMSNVPVKRELTTNGFWSAKILFRERVSRQKSSGSDQVKIYGFTDGEVFEMSSNWLKTAYNLDFDAFEQQHLLSPQNQ